MTFCIMSWKSSFHRATIVPVTHSVAVNCVFFLRASSQKLFASSFLYFQTKRHIFLLKKKTWNVALMQQKRIDQRLNSAAHTSSFLSRRYVACLIHYVIVNWTFVCIIHYAVVSKYSVAPNYDAKHAIFSLFKPKIKSSHIQCMWLRKYESQF